MVCELVIVKGELSIHGVPHFKHTSKIDFRYAGNSLYRKLHEKILEISKMFCIS